MNSNELNGLFEDWNEVYKKGQLTFWILLSIYDGKKYAAQINDYVMDVTRGAFSVKEQSLYRALRRFSDMGLVEITKEDSPNGGPQRNYFGLNENGTMLLQKFVNQNITPLSDQRVESILYKIREENR